MVEKAVNVEVKVNLQPPSETKEIDSKYPRGYRLLIKKTRIMPIKSTGIRLQKTRLSPTIHLLLISFRPRPPQKTSAEAVKKVIQPVGSMLSR